MRYYQNWNKSVSMRRYSPCHNSTYCVYAFLAVLLIVNFIILYRLGLLASQADEKKEKLLIKNDVNRHAIDATFILSEFEEFSNDVPHTLGNLSERFPQLSYFIISSRLPYPPLRLTNINNVKLIVTDFYPGLPVAEMRPDHHIQSEYVIIIPDSVRPSVNINLDYMMKFLKEQSRLDKSVSIAAWPTTLNVDCLRLRIDLRSWTLSYSHVLSDTGSKDYINCDAVEGSRYVLMMSTQTLLSFSYPFLRPLHHTLFVQNVLRNGTVAVDMRLGNEDNKWHEGQDVFQHDAHRAWKHKMKETERLKVAFNVLGVKLVQRLIDSNRRNNSAQQFSSSDEWYGCSKKSKRCFDSVVNDVPDFIYAGRWTPPCCLRALRETAAHVFKILTSQGVRFWLEGGSLLGAARTGDIIPWDYDIDIGIYRDDIHRSRQLRALHETSESHEDNEGFVWERATEGNFYRVQYSHINHLHVDIFPFYSRNGTMTKDTWFASHRQDREFSESFLRPLSMIDFVGLSVPAPNNVTAFLEYKFGRDVINDPRYPDARTVV